MHEAMLYEPLPKKSVKCKLCAHGCVIADGKVGFCACRANDNGKLYSLNYGKSTGLALDPIEKKPFYHFRPGTVALSFGTPGCNFRCPRLAMTCGEVVFAQVIGHADAKHGNLFSPFDPPPIKKAGEAGRRVSAKAMESAGSEGQAVLGGSATS